MGLRRDLLRRRPGRCDDREGLTDNRDDIGEGSGGEAPAGAAFFDLDRTLMAGSSVFQFGRAAYKAGLISRRQLARDAVENVRFRLRGSTDEATDALRERIMGMLAGVRVRELERLAPDVLAGVLPRVYPRMLEIAYAHQDAGRPIYVCTAASQEMADLVATVFVFDGAVGSRAEVIDGLYSGRAAGPFTYREGKAQAIRELAEREGIDLAASWGYSDSESDLPMLHAVGHPVAVNPDAELARIAREEGWDILRFERLARRLRVGGAALLAAALGGGLGSVALRRRATPPPRGIPAGLVAARRRAASRIRA
jgi:HAD superfamily hydrolase (TIGR01490 family)